MSGTIIEALKLTKVVDGDTVKVVIDGDEESLRLCCLDTEESRAGGSKPVTNAGKLASKWAKEYFGVNEEGFPTNDVFVDIEFDTKHDGVKNTMGSTRWGQHFILYFYRVRITTCHVHFELSLKVPFIT